MPLTYRVEKDRQLILIISKVNITSEHHPVLVIVKVFLDLIIIEDTLDQNLILRMRGKAYQRRHSAKKKN